MGSDAEGRAIAATVVTVGLQDCASEAANMDGEVLESESASGMN
jgi:hypothetical protein